VATSKPFSFLGHQNHPAEMMIGRRPERQFISAEHEHPVDGQIANAGVRIFADLYADGDVRTDIFAGMSDDGQLGQINLLTGPFDFFARRAGNNLGRDALVFQSQIALEHLLLRHTEAQRDQLSRREQSTQDAPARIAFDVLEQQCRPFDIRSLAHARGNLIFDGDFVLDPQQLLLTFQMRQKTS
jgi:hypothetical protein